MITLVVVDDHPVFRDGVARALAGAGDLQVIGEAGDGRQGLALIAKVDPDVAVVDYQMPDINGVGVAHALHGDHSRTRVLLLSAVTDDAVVFQALQHGAAGYLSKESRRPELIDAVRRVAHGHTVVPPELTSGLVEQMRRHTQPHAPVLTRRERQVLHAFAAGRSIPDLARELFLAPSTIKTHTQNLYEKLGVADRAAAVAVAMRQGLLE